MSTYFFINFLAIIAVINPIGNIPVFLKQSDTLNTFQRRQLVLNSVMLSYWVLLFFLLVIQVIFQTVQVPQALFEIIAGFTLLYVISTRLQSLSEYKTTDTKHNADLSLDTVAQQAIYPLAIPSIVSPQAIITLVILMGNAHLSGTSDLITALTLTLVLSVTAMVLIRADLIASFLGEARIKIISSAMKVVVLFVALESVFSGSKAFLMGFD
ncbi:MarC family protein [Vibrio inusitatus]|uniref:MarC family protein n=1 Tax=Vibrio inusitatus TaxID=413402 RepID=UPI0011443FD5|nr:MarC family protein [Vibrio inusitatus]